ncbi:hypothetical protein BWI97_11320 [Siphonobacter sp. BAB-5405]|uniref:type IX secretion system sortase PorU n=1 Tax=Siphonobacter sp. BAB-5405 TaxID=1864825 RepID=UPI000C7FF33D|nr:type IX secretion system sortase PorU [Siphonobacter sp. BAB-5405]PMD96751.1 hypothetical protein BWI97_11320 [Siphonobacter sp. BAB-5405]
MKQTFIGLLLLLWIPLQSQGQASVLAEGSWLKIGVTKDGVYKLDAAQLRKAGWSTVDPLQLRLYGNGGAALPQPNAIPRQRDLRENALWITGDTDGRLDVEDGIYFYGTSPHEIRLDTLTGRFSHALNPYTDTTYYFLTRSTQGSPKRLTTAPLLTQGTSLTSYDDYLFHENEEINRVTSGRNWYGEVFYVTSERTIPFKIPGALPNTPYQLTSATMGYSSVATQFSLKVNGQPLGSQTIPATSYDRYDFKGMEVATTFPGTIPALPADGTFAVTLTYNRNGDNAAQGALNYLGLQVQRSLSWLDQGFRFRSLASRTLPQVQMTLANAPASLQIWEVSGSNIQQMTLRNGTFGYTPAGRIHEFVAFLPEQALTPASILPTGNQNLQQQNTPQLLIITPPAFRSEAERLAAFRQSHDQLTPLVVSTTEVYNEFSSGRQDPTALRDFIRQLAEQQPGTLQYVLLFGDATFDYKNILQENQGSYVPTYESRESLHPIYSYSSDDYFAFLENTEGEWPETYAGDHTLDVGIGRLPVKTLTEARQMVDKLIHYEGATTRGPWQSRLSFVADDGDFNIHTQDAERLVNLAAATPYHSEKIYLDAYPQTGSGTDQKSPQAQAALANAVREGRLMIAFAGHGGVSGWTQEQILSLRDILGWRNYDRLPLLLTATCEFGRYDNPGVVSGAELALLSAQGGAIALLTTTRPVFASSNALVSEAFMKAAFQPVNGQMPRLGDIFRQTKNNSLAGRVNRNFSLLGDPSMRLAYPQDSIQLVYPDTLRAGAEVTIRGTVPFDGTAWIEVYDQARSYQTLGDENPKFTYQDRKSLLYRGTAPIRSGAFSTRFVVPHSLNAGIGRGVVHVYANSNSATALGIGHPWVGGIALQPVTDLEPPVLRLYMNDEQFQSGGTTDANPTLLAFLSDDTGLSYTENQPMLATLNDTLTLNLNTYFTATDARSGQIRYPFRNLPQGLYQLQVQAFDGFGKKSQQSLQFSVQPYTKRNLRSVRAMPNPFRERVRFTFEHEFQDDDTEITFYLYDLTGRLLHQQTFQSYSTPSPYEDLQLENSELNTGLYIYRIFVRSLTTGLTASGSGKISHIK